MTTERKFDPVSGGANGLSWKPHMTEKNFMKMGLDNVKEGYLLSSRPVQGTNGNGNFEVFLIHTVKEDGTFGEKIEVIGDTVLLDKFKQIPFGSFIRAEYKGRMHKKAIREAPGYHKEAPFTQTNSFHIWEVGVDKGAIPYNEAVKQMPQAPATSVTAAAPTVENKIQGNENLIGENDDLPF